MATQALQGLTQTSLATETDTKEPDEVTPDEVGSLDVPKQVYGFELNDKGLIADPRKVTNGKDAKALVEQGYMSLEQAQVSKAWYVKNKQGLTELNADDANALYKAGYMSEFEADRLQTYYESPFKYWAQELTWYAPKEASMNVLRESFDAAVNLSFSARELLSEIGDTLFKPEREHGEKVTNERTLELLKVDNSTLKEPSLTESIEAQTPEWIKVNDTDGTTSGIGKGAEGMYRFIMGFVPANKMLKGASSLSQANRWMLGGALSDAFVFDGNEEHRVSDLLKSFDKEHQDAVLYYLASDRNDNELVGRLKNAFEGVVVGGALDSFVGALKIAKGALLTKTNSSPELMAKTIEDLKAGAGIKAEANEAQPQVASNAFTDANRAFDEKLPMVERLVNDEDISKVLAKLEKDMPAQSFNDTKVIAKQIEEEYGKNFARAITSLGDDTSNLAARLVAARRMLKEFDSSLKTLVDDNIARANTMTPPTLAEDIELLIKIKQSGKLQNVLFGVSRNLGRALNAHKIEISPSKVIDLDTINPKELMEDIKELGGHENIRKVINEYQRVANYGNAKALHKYTRKLNGYGLKAFIDGYFLGNILSGISTQGVNLISNTANIVVGNLEHAFAMTARSLTTGDMRHMAEIGYKARGQMLGLIEAFKIGRFSKDGKNGIFYRAFKANHPIMDAGVKVEDNTLSRMPTMLSDGAEAYKARLGDVTGFGKGFDALYGYLGDAVSIPLRLLQASDEAFKAISYRGEIYRQAIEGANLNSMNGLFRNAAEKEAFIREAIEAPTKQQHELAIARARDDTFTSAINPNVGEDILNHRFFKHVPHLGVGMDVGANFITRLKHMPGFISYPAKLLIPFINTPLNIVKATGRRSPFAVFSRKFQSDFIAGGSRRAEALTRVASGTAMMMTTAYLYENGYIVGKVPKHLKAAFEAQGGKEYSIKIGDTWVSYNRFDPFGMTLGIITDMLTAKDIYEATPQQEQELGKLGIGVMAALSNNLLNKTYMKNLGDVVKAITDPEQGSFARVGGNILSAYSPYSSLWGQIASELNDNKQVQSKSLFEYATAKIWPHALEPKLNFLGDPLFKTPRALMVFDYSKTSSDPLMRKLFEYNVNIPELKDILEYKGSKFRLTPEEVNEIKTIAGKELGLRDMLEQVVDMPGLNDIYNDDAIGKQLSKIIGSTYRSARQIFMLRHPDKMDIAIDTAINKATSITDPELAKRENERAVPIPSLRKAKQDNKLKEMLQNDR